MDADELFLLALASSCAVLLAVYLQLCHLHERLVASLAAKLPDTLTDALLMPTADNTRVPELKEISSEGWSLACDIHEPKLLKVYTQLQGGRFALRFVCEVDAGVAEIMSLPREADLIPTWNPFCSWAKVERLLGPLELWASAIATLPWPIPPHKVLLHARLVDCMAEDASFVCVARTPTKFDAPISNEAAALTREIPVDLGICRLVPEVVGPTDPPRTGLDTVLRIDLTKIAFLGGASRAPQWLLNMVLYFVIPFVWRRALRMLSEGFTRPDEPYARRVASDETGVYRIIRHATGQSPML